MTAVLLAIQVYLGTVLGVAGVSKLDDIGGFAEVVQRQGILPRALVGMVVIALPVAEVFLAFWLLSGVFPLASAGLIGLVFAGFFAFRVRSMRRDPAAECGCYGSSSLRKTWPEAVSVSSLMLLMALALMPLWLSAEPATSDRVLAAGPSVFMLGALSAVVITRHSSLADIRSVAMWKWNSEKNGK